MLDVNGYNRNDRFVRRQTRRRPAFVCCTNIPFFFRSPLALAMNPYGRKVVDDYVNTASAERGNPALLGQLRDGSFSTGTRARGVVQHPRSMILPVLQIARPRVGRLVRPCFSCFRPLYLGPKRIANP